MALIKVKAKIGGTHALSGIGLVVGEEYMIEEAHYGPEVFALVGTDFKSIPEGSGRERGDKAAVPPTKEEKEG